MASLNNRETNKALFKNTGIIAIGQISTKIVSFLLLPLYTALLTTSEYGLADLLVTYSTLLRVVVGLQLNQAIFRFLVTKRDDENEKKKLVSTIFISTIALFAIYSVGFFVISPFLTLEYKWFLLVHVIATILLQTLSGVARGFGNNGVYAVGNFISSTVVIIVNVVLITGFHMGILSMLIAYIAGPVVGTIYLSFKCKIHRYFVIGEFDKFKAKEILRYSIPLVPNELSWSILHSSDRWIVSSFISVAANGLIAVASKFSVIYTTFFSIFNTSWTEQVVLHYKDEAGAEYVNTMFDKMITFFACFSALIIAVMPIAYPILINNQYQNAYGMVPLYMIAVFFNAIIGMLSAIYLVNNETKQVATSTIVAAIVNIVVDLLLIRVVGAYAAPISSIAGYMAISVWRLWDINKRHCHIGIKLKKVMIILGTYGISIVTFFIKGLLFQVVGIAIVLLLSFVLNKEFVQELSHMVLARGKRNG